MPNAVEVHSPFYTSLTPVSLLAPDQLRQEPGKPDRTRPAGQEPGPERQRQLLRPFRQGLPSARERVRFWCCLWPKECPVCVSLSASVSLSCFLSPVSFWPCNDCAVCLKLTNYSSWYERMRMDATIWGSHLSLIEFHLLETLLGCRKLVHKEVKGQSEAGKCQVERWPFLWKQAVHWSEIAVPSQRPLPYTFWVYFSSIVCSIVSQRAWE